MPDSLQGNPCESALNAWCANYLSLATNPTAANASAPQIGIAYSAGADSTALLLAAHRRWPGQVVALHVHHGLQSAADDFEALARRVCELHQIALRVAHINAHKQHGESPEAAARGHRYAALARMGREAGVACVLLGQHADDQVETFLLALSRGAGLPGLSAMPARFERHGMVFGRPLLALPAAHLRHWLVQRQHAFVDDPSNTDEQLTRNRIRARLMPVWEQCFPGFRTQLARSAQHAAQAQRLLAELAESDLQWVGSPPAVQALQALRSERQANVLRHWLHSCHGVLPSTAQLHELQRQIAACRTRGHHIRLKVASGFVLRTGSRLSYTLTDIIPPLSAAQQERSASAG